MEPRGHVVVSSLPSRRRLIVVMPAFQAAARGVMDHVLCYLLYRVSACPAGGLVDQSL